MTKYDPDDLEKDLDQNTRDVMLDVILQWARYDAIISQWTLLAFGMPLDSGSILLGTMDTRTKLDRLKALYEHNGFKDNVKAIAALQKKHKHHVGVRNSIAHATCAGRWKSNPKRIVFAPVKAFKGTLGHMMVEHIHLDQMIAAAAFASDAADRLMKIVDKLAELRRVPETEPPAPPQASRPTPRKSAAGKRPPPLPKRKG